MRAFEPASELSEAYPSRSHSPAGPTGIKTISLPSTMLRFSATPGYAFLTSSKGFRSSTPNTGVLDPEFEAFQAGLPLGPSLLDDTPIHPLLPHAPHFLPQSPSFAPSGWANDFQRSITPSLQAQPYHAPVAQHNSVPSWHSDFLRTQTPTFAAQQPTFQPTFNPMNNFSMGYTPQFSSVAQGKQKASEPVVQDPFDMAAFERAFDEAHMDIMEADEQAAQAIRELQEETNRMAAQETNIMEQDILLESKVSQLPDSIAAEHERSLFEENSLEHEPVHEDKQQQEHKLDDDDDLSRVAGQLLDSVSHENSNKFQNSVFLQLMRRIRDKEVRVEGEKFVEVST